MGDRRPDVPSFDRFAGDYESHLDRTVRITGEGSEYFAEYKARYLASLVPPDFPGKVLDFGCGPGLVAQFLGPLLPRAELHGYDESAEMVARFRERAGRGRFVADRRELDRDYDLIVIANVLHHVPPDGRPAAVHQLGARLRPSGRLVVFEHNPVNPLTRWAVSRCPFDEGVQLLGPTETVGHLRSAGLDAPSVRYIVFFPRALSWCRPLESRLGWCPLGAQYVALGTRRAGP
ncbi:MAG: class I SAM-dependent methyltransferase [Candidatus Rokuibacteriota bacterium]